ncbi:MAG: helix-turn-helix transcriptional regulator [Candidatus Gastranaerophilales bacterium]
MDREIFLKLGYHVKYKRDLKNISQEKLAELADISLSIISDLERGRGNMTIRNLYKIAKVLDIDLGMLTNPQI